MTAVLQRPTVRLRVNDAPVPTADLAALISLDVRQRLSFPSQLTATFLDASTTGELDDQPPVAGLDDDVVIQLEDGTELFAGRVWGREREWSNGGVSTTTIRAYDRLHNLRTGTTVRRHATAAVAETCAAVTSDYGLACAFEADDVDLGEPILQYAESDFALLHRLGALVGMSFICDGKTLSFFSDHVAGDHVELAVGTDLIRVGIDERAAQEMDQPDVLAWHESLAVATREGNGAPSGGWLMYPAVVAAQSQALQRRAERNKLVATGVAVGTPDLSPGRRCRITLDPGVTPGGEVELVVTTTCHRFSTADGYITEFSSEPTTAAAAPVAATYTLGFVVDLADPEGRGRVRVALTAYDDIETGWLPVILPGAGAERGVIAIPDVDDSVVILGPADDVGKGVVLGGIAAGTSLAGEPTESGRNTRLVVQLPNGAAVTLENDGLRIDDGFGSSIDLRQDKVSLYSATDLEIAAPGQRVLISGDAIDFERS